ncbi:MAG: DUF3417 domain-containing protein, partial [Muribaculaceae bacterium]|nr:DUF3417 domain-containing protein [Muribaculaceae bacterium]
LTRMINDYIDRFYTKEAKRSAALQANDYAMAKEIAAWKQRVAEKWNGVKVISVEDDGIGAAVTGTVQKATVVLDTNGLGKDLGVECVAFRSEDGEEKFSEAVALSPVSEEGSIVTYKLNHTLTEPGLFRYAFRIYPSNPALPHRQDFAWVRWI